MKKPVTVTITGAAGNIGYALAFRVASGQMLGADQPVNLNLLEIPPAIGAAQGVVMELNDCAFPTLNKISASDDANTAFRDCDYAMLVGARPRGPGMERKDLLLANAKIFSAQRKAPSLPARNFTAMTRLDHNRGLALLADKTGSADGAERKFIVWGTPSATQYPDLNHATVGGKSAVSLVDQAWFRETFIPTVQQRGAAIIKARGTSSAASAASA